MRWPGRGLFLGLVIVETGPVTERLRVREIDDDEGRRLVRIVRRAGSGRPGGAAAAGVGGGLPVLLPPRSALLAGREEPLAGLDTRLSGGNEPWPRVVALYGLGGAGNHGGCQVRALLQQVAGLAESSARGCLCRSSHNDHGHPRFMAAAHPFAKVI
jgi:hypothetical protein